jgi:hypothetical protein
LTRYEPSANTSFGGFDRPVLAEEEDAVVALPNGFFLTGSFVVTANLLSCHFDFSDQIESCFIQSHAVRTNDIGMTFVT